MHPRKWIALAFAPVVALGAAAALADGGVTFTNIADDPASGLTGYSHKHTPSRLAIREALIANPIPTSSFFPGAQIQDATKPYGAPGVVLFDYDNDGDDDIYVSNGPGRANSLFENRLIPDGILTFNERAAEAGVGATDQDSTGVCAGDIDNDGDRDLFVVGAESQSILFENNGDGTFTDITASAGVGGTGEVVATSCSFGDADGDGLIDIFVSNNLDSWDNRNLTFTPDDSGVVENDLFRNLGGNVFEDVSAASGIQDVINMPNGSWTWVGSFVDIDRDGDQDLIVDDMQGPASGGDPALVRSASRLFENDGTGHFTEITDQVGLYVEGGWMGLAFADYDCNGYMDFFSSNLGEYFAPNANPAATSSWWLQQPDGTWVSGGPGSLGRTPFGWGASPLDYDNDGDTDIIYHGSGDNLLQHTADNPGALLQNIDCTGDFNYDADAGWDVDHRTRGTEGVAIGDLDRDGFDDIVTVASYKWEKNRFFPYVGILVPPLDGAQFDAEAFFDFNFTSLANPGFWTWVGADYTEGDLTVEINSCGNGNHWVQFETVGSAGILPTGTVNRDGIGAVLSFTPNGGKTSMRPVVAGSSYASQDSARIGFGLGDANKGTLDVLWPGGIKTRVYDVGHREQLTVPAIPCGYNRYWKNFGAYNSCVTHALNIFQKKGVITPRERNRLQASAKRAYQETIACEDH